jgi:uncharacterized protein with HEPN domain
MSFEPRDYLRHILAEAEFLIEEASSVTESEFHNSAVLKRAFVRSLEVMGEAVKQLPADFRDAHREVEWQRMAGMRDRLIHGYFGVDYDLVWNVVQTRVPQLRDQLAAILES